MFSTFPSGRPGIGLLVLRAALGFTLVAHGGGYLIRWHELALSTRGVCLLAVVTGVSLLIGYLTPLASVMAGLTIISTMFLWRGFHSFPMFDSNVAVELATSMAIALVCLGPGAISIDARMFGRREIIIPPREQPVID